MARGDDLRRGIESRTDKGGRERHRARPVRVPGTTLRSKPGPWRSSLAAARGDRNRLLGRQEAGALLRDATQLPAFRMAAEAWLDLCDDGQALARGRGGKRKPYAPKTRRDYRRDLELYVFPDLGDTPVDRVKRSSLQRVVDEVHALHSGQRARNVITPVQSLYRYLLPRHDDLADPTVGLDLPSGSAPRERIATPSELAALLQAVDDVQDRAAFALAGYAGLRASEIVMLHVEDVHLLERRISVCWSMDRVAGPKLPKTDAGHRDVPIFDALLEPLGAQLAELGPDHEGLVFPGRGRFGQMSAGASLVRLREAWGDLEPLGLHEARHSFASHLVAAGYDVAMVSKWVGHSNISTTLDRYVKPVGGDLSTAAEKMRAWLGTQGGTHVAETPEVA